MCGEANLRTVLFILKLSSFSREKEKKAMIKLYMNIFSFFNYSGNQTEQNAESVLYLCESLLHLLPKIKSL